MTMFRTLLSIVAFIFCCVTTTRVLAELIPRTPLPKPVTITKPLLFDSRLTVKFRDDLKVRAVKGDIASQVGADLGNVQATKAQFALTFQQLIQLPQATLDFIEARAAQRSGIAQPDLAGMAEVNGPEATIEAAAQALTLILAREVESGMLLVDQSRHRPRRGCAEQRLPGSVVRPPPTTCARGEQRGNNKPVSEC